LARADKGDRGGDHARVCLPLIIMLTVRRPYTRTRLRGDVEFMRSILQRHDALVIDVDTGSTSGVRVFTFSSLPMATVWTASWRWSRQQQVRLSRTSSELERSVLRQAWAYKCSDESAVVRNGLLPSLHHQWPRVLIITFPSRGVGQFDKE
jgi:hypothetical protein